jgi:hypothetical protein
MPLVPFGGPPHGGSVEPDAVHAALMVLTAVSESGRVGWQVTVWPAWLAKGVQESSVSSWVLITVMVSLPRLSTKSRLASLLSTA